jgi:type VI protein secretion system component VasF
MQDVPLMLRREVKEMEQKNEESLPIVVWIVVIGIAALLVVGFVLFLK